MPEIHKCQYFEDQEQPADAKDVAPHILISYTIKDDWFHVFQCPDHFRQKPLKTLIVYTSVVLEREMQQRLPDTSVKILCVQELEYVIPHLSEYCIRLCFGVVVIPILEHCLKH